MLDFSPVSLKFLSSEPFAGGGADTQRAQLLPLLLSEPQLTPSVPEILKDSPIFQCKRSAVGRLAAMIPDAVLLMRLGGINAPGEDSIELIDLYTQKPDRENWSNCYEHCVLVALGIEAVLGAVRAKGLMDETWIKEGLQLGLVHDANRRYEQLEQNARKRKESTGETFVALTKEDFAASGLDARLLSFLFEFDQPTGGEYSWKFYRVDEGAVVSKVAELIDVLKPLSSKPELLAEALSSNRKLIIDACAAMLDNFLYTNIPKESGQPAQHYFLGSLERLLACQNRSWYSLLWQHGYIVSEGSMKYWRNIGELPQGAALVANIASVQVSLSRDIASLFQLILSGEVTAEPEKFVLQLLRAGFEKQ